jgi:hypothetical protein
MSARSTSRLALAALLGAALLGGCAVDPRIRARQLEDEQRSLTAAVQAADQAVQAATSYAAEVSAPGQAGPTFSLYFTPAMLEQLSSQMLPYRAPARDFHGKLTGEIIVERLSGLRFLSRNRLMGTLHLRGVNVRYTGAVPGFAKKQVQEFQAAIAKGAVADLEVQLTLEGNVVRARAKALSARLVSKRDGNAEGMLRDEMNKRALRGALSFDMSIAGSSAAPRRLIVTGNHVVVTYQ